MPGLVTFRNKGNFSKVDAYFKRLLKVDISKTLEKYGKKGVAALSAATPMDTGKTASSWYYTVSRKGSVYSISFSNSNMSENWFPVALMLDIGHGTNEGGWVEGRHYIDPAIRPIFDNLLDAAWEEVRKL